MPLSALLQAEASAPKVDAGRCGTFENGQAKLKLCVDPVQSWGNDVIAVRHQSELLEFSIFLPRPLTSWLL